MAYRARPLNVLGPRGRPTSMGRAQALQSTLQAVLQDVCLDIGGERASLQWKISLRVSESLHVREYTLWDQAPTAEFVHAQVDVHGASKALYTHVESRDGRMVLHVPPIERPCTIALTIYAKIAFLPRLSGAPTAVRAYDLHRSDALFSCVSTMYFNAAFSRTRCPSMYAQSTLNAYPWPGGWNAVQRLFGPLTLYL